MKYQKLIDGVNKFEEEFRKIMHFYLEALEDLREVREDLRRLDVYQHLEGTMKNKFLVNWGGKSIARVVNRKDIDWSALGETLRGLEKKFGELGSRSFRTIDFDEETVSNTIRTIYGKLKQIKYLRGPTISSHILHLFNPEIFVMWNQHIRKEYNERNSRIRDTPEGYLEFLKENQKEIKEALEDRKRENCRGLDEIERELRLTCYNKTLAKIVDEYNHISYR